MVCLLVAGLAGCNEQEPIRSYTVAKPPAPKKAPLPQPDMKRPAARPQRTDPPTDRILGAMIPHGEQTWFFKLQGSVDTSLKVIEPFLRFIRGLRFEQEQPVWNLPEGWKVAANPEGKGRFATLAISVGEETLDLTISALPTAKTDLQSYLLMNVNRWRGQLQLGEIGPEEFADRSIPIELADKSTAWLVNLEGWGASGAAGPPMAAGGTRPAPANPKLPFPYQVPQGWTPGELNQFRLAAWKVQDGDQQAVITVSTAGGDLIGNIARWRDQVKLPRADAAAVRESIREVKMGSATAAYVVLTAPEGVEKPQTILGAIVSALGQQWFFKLQGDSPLAAREQEKFESFVKSVEFP